MWQERTRMGHVFRGKAFGDGFCQPSMIILGIVQNLDLAHYPTKKGHGWVPKKNASVYTKNAHVETAAGLDRNP
jgi:hypothetical protein